MKTGRITSFLADGLNAPVVIWFLVGYAIAYLCFFIVPVFLNSAQTMKSVQEIRPARTIGLDLKNIISAGDTWLVEKQLPYARPEKYFPPLAIMIFTPLLLAGAPLAYAIITIITLSCFMLTTFPVSFREKSPQFSALPSFLFLTGLFSYGLIFEFERGQWNVIAFSLCLLSLYLFYNHHKYRYLAYLLFSVAVQLKVYPAIFVLMFIEPNARLRTNLTRLIAILSFNAALLFVLGPQEALNFLSTLKENSLNPTNQWPGNHSVKSFLNLMSETIAGNPQLQRFAWLTSYRWLAELIMLGSVAVCLGLLVINGYKQRLTGVNKHLLLACCIAACLIPSVSNDYKLSILPMAFAVALPERLPSALTTRSKLLSFFLILLIAIAYSSTLFSHANVPRYLQSNLPALMVMLFAITALGVLRKQAHQIGSVVERKVKGWEMAHLANAKARTIA